MRERWLYSLVIACVLAGAFVVAQTVGAPSLTREETLLQTIAALQAQLAQTSGALARCEASGPESSQWAQQAQATYRTLTDALKARGLELDPKTGAVRAISTTPPKP